jgi:hypothetical protein
MPNPAGIPEIFLFCQNCGTDIDLDFVRSGNADSACNCHSESRKETFAWISSNSKIFHHFQGMNYLMIGESSALFCSHKNSVFFEL